RLKKVKPATVNRDLNLISVVINTGRKDWGLPIENPVGMIRRPKNPRGRERRLEPEEEQQLLDALDNDQQPNRSPWVRPLVIFALETGMRRGEIISLKWENVDLRRCVARLEDTKNGESRAVPLSSRARTVLEGLPRSIDGRVFPLTVNALKLVFVRAVRRSKIVDLTFHDLRHEAASRLANLLSAHELAKVMGWRTMQMALRYYHPRAEELARKLG
ncbi:MAG: site-specific integrase, partial [Sulfuricella sp.]